MSSEEEMRNETMKKKASLQSFKWEGNSGANTA